VPTRRRKQRRLGVSATPADPLRAEHTITWALDYQQDRSSHGRQLKLLKASTSTPLCVSLR
jgi:hypothetical protein